MTPHIGAVLVIIYHSSKYTQPRQKLLIHASTIYNFTCSLDIRDFVTDLRTNTADYFSSVRAKQEYPEFTVRNINQLLSEPQPLLHNVYEFIRGREIFDRVESYRAFLDDIRLWVPISRFVSSC